MVAGMYRGRIEALAFSAEPRFEPTTTDLLRTGSRGMNRSFASSHIASSALPSLSKGKSQIHRRMRVFSKAANPAPASNLRPAANT
jgi:hypothetical protein